MTKELNEVLRYLGYKNQPADDATMALIQKGKEELLLAASPKSVLLRMPLAFLAEPTLFAGGITIKSQALWNHLENCQEIYFFGATLGILVDRLLARYSKTNMGYALVLQAIAATMMEEYCDECQEKLEKQVAEENLFLRSRFSPGYGDFSVEHQEKILSLLKAPEKIGLSATASSMLVPTKSVTALIGISSCSKKKMRKCDECENTQCSFRKDGATS